MYNLILIKDEGKALEELSRLLADRGQSFQLTTLQEIISHFEHNSKRRLIIRKGLEWLALKLEDIVLFYTENKLVYCIDRSGKKYLTDKQLSGLEQELDQSLFFRANRQYIINLNFIKGFKPYEKVKLQVDLTMQDLSHQVIVSQETAPEFRRWIFSA